MKKRVTCCNCQMPMCNNCFFAYIKNNSGWCPYCTRHLLFVGLGKTSIRIEYMGDIFDAFVGDEMKNILTKTNLVIPVDASYLAEKWKTFVFNM